MMPVSKILYLSLLMGLVLLGSGCSGTPRRNLVSDVCMLKTGQSSRQDVLAIMGVPDTKRRVKAGLEEWVYYEEDRAVLQDTPMLGQLFLANGYNKVIVTLQGDTVEAASYSGYQKDEFDWQDDYSWQETGQQ